MPADFPHVEGVSHHFVKSGELTFHVAEAGDGPPLVLIHGWPQHWFMWRLLMPKLALHYRVIAPDLRGFGWSDAPPGGYGKENMAIDMLDLLDELGVEQPVRLIGHDWGGWIGYLMCLRAPSRFSHYLSLAIPPPWGGKRSSFAREAWRFWYQIGISLPVLGPRAVASGNNIQRGIAGSSKVRSNYTPGVLDQYADRLRIPERAKASQLLYRTFLTKELPKIVAGTYVKERMTVPVLSLIGRHDPAVAPALVEGSEHQADAMEIRVLEDSGHFIAEEVPEQVLEHALPFFAGESGPQPRSSEA